MEEMMAEPLRNRLNALRRSVLTKPLRMLLLAAIVTSGWLAGKLVNFPTSDLIGLLMATVPASLLVDRWLKETKTAD
jgi:hypothetical protein